MYLTSEIFHSGMIEHRIPRTLKEEDTDNSATTLSSWHLLFVHDGTGQVVKLSRPKPHYLQVSTSESAVTRPPIPNLDQ